MSGMPHRHLSHLLIATLSSIGLLGGAQPAAATLYKCVGPDGKMGFQDRPCAAGQRSTEIDRAAPETEDETTPEPNEVTLQMPAKGESGSGSGFRIDTTEVQSAVWLDAIAQAGRQAPLRSGSGRITLIRVLLEGDRGANVQLRAIKLKELEESNGGGTYRELSHGDFVLLEHINSSTRKGGKDLLTIASTSHGRAEIRVPVPDRGVLAIFGDVILSEASEDQKGILEATLATDGVAGLPRNISMRLGAIAVGGLYGESFEFDSRGRIAPTSLAAGSYKIAMPDFDVVKSRFDIEIGSGERLKIEFRAKSPQVVELREISRESQAASSAR